MTDFSLVFNDEAYVMQCLNDNHGICNYGYPWNFENGGRSGILLKSITPSNKVLYTKIKISPFCCVYANGSISNVNGKYNDNYNTIMPLDGTTVKEGFYCLTNGDFFTVVMYIKYNNNSEEITLSKTERIYTDHTT